MEITTAEIKELRDRSGVSIMQCKKALEEAEGDMEKAAVILQKQSKKAATKKADRELGAGTIHAYIHGEGAVGAMVELSCETDFVSKNEDFKKLAYDLAMHVAAADPEFLKMDDIKEEDKTKAREVFKEDVKDKPENLQEQIIENKLASYFGEKTLLEQVYIKDPQQSIQNLVEEATQKFGERVEVTRFSRFSIA